VNAKQIFCYCIVGLILFSPWSKLIASEQNPDLLLNMDIEDLMSVEVFSVSKYEQLLINTPAAITVITSQDIQNSGLNKLPDILSLVPGMQVVRDTDGLFSVSARSIPFYGEKKMLVLLDERSIFSQATGTVTWSNQSFLLEDIEKIEVIRGPGGTSWGYNAVDGVVNIISKKPEDTLGFSGQTIVTNNRYKSFQTRFGGRYSNSSFYKIYAAGSKDEIQRSLGSFTIKDTISKDKCGFRFDFHPDNNKDLISMEAAVSNSNYDSFYNGEDIFKETFIKGEWTKTISDIVNFKIITHYDNSKQIYQQIKTAKAFAIGIKQFNTEAQINFKTGEKNHFIAGIGFKNTKFISSDGYSIHFLQKGDRWNNYNIFISDEIIILENKLWVTAGTKLEHNTNTKFGWQPNIRFLYKPDPGQSIWLAVSKALRAPDFRDASKRIITTMFYDEHGNLFTFYDKYIPTQLKDERLIAYEAGYRIKIQDHTSMELAVFLNDYNNIPTSTMTMIDSENYLIDNKYDNSLKSYGAEFSLAYNPFKTWYLKGSYSYLHCTYHYGTSVSNTKEASIIQRFQIHYHINATDKLAINTHACWNNQSEINQLETPAYLGIGIGINYKISDNIEMTIDGANLLKKKHSEIVDKLFDYERYEIPSSLSLKLKVVF